MDRLDTLRTFIVVAESQGFASAARRLGYSPAAVTRAIAALEQRIGAQLLLRTTRSVRVTEIGERFLEDCRRILADLEEAEAAAGGAYAAPRGQLAITAPSLFGRLHVAPIVLEFMDRYPGVTVRSFFVNRIVHLLDEGIDVAVRIAQLPDSGLTAVQVGSLRRVVVASPEYLAQRGAPQTPSDLVNHDAIGFSQTGGQSAPWSFYAPHDKAASGRQVVQPRMQLVANASEISIDAAVRGRGLARAISYQVANDVKAGRLQIVLRDYEAMPVPVHLVYPSGRKAPAKVRAFIDIATERLRREPVLGEAGAVL